MRKLIALLLLSATGLGNTCAAPPLPSSHPILGIWRLSLPEVGCFEVYRFRGDGTTLVTSAGEVSESEFHIPTRPSEKGFYKLEDKITKDNGKQDCAGAIIKVGTRAINFIRFHPSGELFLMCADETMDSCIGPFERIPGRTA